MSRKYSYWTVATGADVNRLQRCVASARQCGIGEDFHVFVDRPIEGADCCEAFGVDTQRGLHLFSYLKAGLANLACDYFVYIDPNSLFQESPTDLLDVMSKAPIHTHLIDLAGPPGPYRAFADRMRDRLIEGGVRPPALYTYPLFWIIHHDLIDRAFELSGSFMAGLDGKGFVWNADVALSYVMQMFCANPSKHLFHEDSTLWQTGIFGSGTHRRHGAIQHCFTGRLDELPWYSGDARGIAPTDSVYTWQGLTPRQTAIPHKRLSPISPSPHEHESLHH